MKGVRKFQDVLRRDLKDKAFRKAFEEEETFASLAIQVAKLREEHNLTQKKLAKLLHTSQQNISRLEDPYNTSISLKTLVKLAHVFDKGLRVKFV